METVLTGIYSWTVLNKRKGAFYTIMYLLCSLPLQEALNQRGDIEIHVQVLNVFCGPRMNLPAMWRVIYKRKATASLQW